MGLLSWIVLGAIAGYLAKFLVGGGEGVIGTIVLGVIGAIAGGLIASTLHAGTISGLNLQSIVLATVGAIVVVVGARALAGRRAGV